MTEQFDMPLDIMGHFGDKFFTQLITGTVSRYTKTKTNMSDKTCRKHLQKLKPAGHCLSVRTEHTIVLMAGHSYGT